MTECEKVICKMYLEDMRDNCNENRLLLQMLEAEPCEDCISRQAAIEEIEQWVNNGECFMRGDANSLLYARLKGLPPVIPSRPTGHWKPIGYDGYADGCPVIDEWECSECGWEHYGDADTLTAFCPYCGAAMTEREEQA